MSVTWIISTQCLNLVGTVIRKNVRCMRIWRLRNHKEMEILCEELSGIYTKEDIMELYRYATSEPYSFLFVRLDAKTRDDMFWLRFEKKLALGNDADASDLHGRPLAASPGSLQQVRQAGSQSGPAPSTALPAPGPGR